MKNIALLSSALILFISSVIYSQITLQIGAGGGYISPTGDFAGSTVDFYNGTNYGMSSGYNINAKVRVGLIGINLFGAVEYSSISGDGQSDPDNKNSQIENTQNILSIKAGPEFNFPIPMSPFSFYIDGFISVNNFSGTVNFQGVSGVSTGEYDLESATRVGAGGGGGVLWNVFSIITLDFGANYNWYNITGKQFTASSTNSDRLDSYTSLNDDADPLYQDGSSDHFIGDSRSISAWQFTLTAMIGI